MRSTSTQMLLLGAVGLFGPVNGYQIRRELLSWQVDRWLNVQPGSIYHALTQLSRSGLLTRHDLRDGSRDVAVYELTATGTRRLHELIAEAVLDVDIFDRTAFQAAFGLLPLIGDEHALELLDERLRRATAELQRHRDDGDPSANPYAPPHALRALALFGDLAQAELTWLADVVADLRSGRLRLASTAWAPPADDPGHQMTADRARYHEMIARRSVEQDTATSE
ncbi:PadR family transcriptional regulator [Gordonia desulfuricans]|uniref:PadR family transcriptional regulator n=1 Tax=Gordonia desulfuricans TaxID=89051 RepID=A0A7K3LM76_9ACTN|nr:MULTISPECIES: PadR family transcriptional regulator [Gordonia]KOY49087.1 PadR family transcriptional regulator [Gordonia sp. NB41Y]NDK89283.1 PadR family transcriptional regulator [Gordonia desulfuricans]WLP91793.1 PadR family transcriptional regulator [Gordonia sp. NB41Y]